MRRLAALALAMLFGPGRDAGSEPAKPSAGAFRLMTYNLEFNNPNPGATLDAIAAADPDVALFQEVTSTWRDALVGRLGSRYPYRAFYPGRAGGLGVVSKLPIANEEKLPPVDWFPAQRVTVSTGFGPVEILNVHLRPAIERGSWVRGYLTTPPIRRREIEAHYKRLSTGMATIIAGDFNEDPTGTAVAFVAKQGLTRVVPQGPSTWHYATGTLDVLRLDIDHVMVRGVTAHDGRVLDAGTSDHRPVVVTIAPP